LRGAEQGECASVFDVTLGVATEPDNVGRALSIPFVATQGAVVAAQSP
jgi:hypothetical protein